MRWATPVERLQPHVRATASVRYLPERSEKVAVR